MQFGSRSGDSALGPAFTAGATKQQVMTGVDKPARRSWCACNWLNRILGLELKREYEMLRASRQKVHSSLFGLQPLASTDRGKRWLHKQDFVLVHLAVCDGIWRARARARLRARDMPVSVIPSSWEAWQAQCDAWATRRNQACWRGCRCKK